MIRWTLTFLVDALLLTGETAGGCPSCFAEAEPQQRQAYLGTTVFLSALPLLLLGFLALCIYRWFGRTDVHSSVDLHRVDADDLAAGASGEFSSESALTASGTADDER